MWTRQSAWLFPTLLVGVLLLAVHMRAPLVSQAAVGSDSLGPYLAAWAARNGAWPSPPNPESGAGLWWSALPLTGWADNLQDLFSWRFLLGALVAPLAASAAWILAPGGRLPKFSAALAAGTWLALDPGLMDSLVSGARGYGAPEWVGVSTLGVALAHVGWPLGAPLALLAGAMATEHHPLALGPLLAMGWLVPEWRRRFGGRFLGISLCCVSIFLVPRMIHLADLASCGEGVFACLSSVAGSNTAVQPDRLGILETALHDRLAVDLGPVAWVLPVGLVLAMRDRKPVAWMLGAAAILLGMGLLNGYLQSYHLRILAVPLVVCAAAGLARWWWAGLAMAGMGLVVWINAPVIGPDDGAAARADALAERLADQPGPQRVDLAWFDGPPRMDASAVVLAAVLQGQDPARFQLVPGAAVLLLVSGTPAAGLSGVALDAGPGWAAVRFSDLDEARAWVRAQPGETTHVGGAFDWAKALHPHGVDLGAATW